MHLHHSSAADDLRSILKRLQLPSNAPIPLSSQATNQWLTIDTYLSQLMRQGYLEKLHVGPTAGKGKTAGSKRARAAQSQVPGGSGGGGGDDAHLQAFEWRWGPRALTEVGERGVAQFVAEFMAGQPGHGDDGEDGEEEEDAVAAARDEGTQRRVQAIFKGIERAAAGGQLLEAR